MRGRALDTVGPLLVIVVLCAIAGCAIAVSETPAPADQVWQEGLVIGAQMVAFMLPWWVGAAAVVVALPLRSVAAQFVAAGAVCAAMVTPFLVSTVVYAVRRDAWQSGPLGFALAMAASAPPVLAGLWAGGVGLVRLASIERAKRAAPDDAATAAPDAR